jgi:DNA ligase 1
LKFKLDTGVPLYPALGTPIRSIDEIYQHFGEMPFAAEYKYDGQRAQIHVRRSDKEEAEVRIFSRHLEDMTSKV